MSINAKIPLTTCFVVPLMISGTLPAQDVTFSKDVAPILYRRCAACHHPNDIAPMSLLRYEDVRPWARAIREAVITRKMPPWYADPSVGKFQNDPTLSREEIETISRWADQGAKQGDPKDAPPPPEFADGWRIGKPDVIFTIPQEYTIAAHAPDDYQLFLDIPTGFSHDVWVKAIELRPGNRKVVHHAHVFITLPDKKGASGDSSLLNRYTFKTGSVRHMRTDAPVIDDACRDIGEGGIPDLKFHEEAEELTTFVPGRAPEIYPEGYARLIPAGAKIGFQIHYAPNPGHAEKDRTSVGLILADGPPKKVLRRLDMDAYLFRILPGEPDHEVTICHDFKEDVRLLAVTPHMHLRGKDMKWELLRPDAVKETLISVPRYDFNWQIEYKFKQPIPAPKGSRLIVTAHFDNSANNPSNPDPNKAVRWGEPTSDEMAATWVTYDLGDKPKREAGPAATTAENGR